MDLTNHAPIHILIIDDEPMILKLLSKILANKNIKIDTARNGEEGIRKIESNKYNLIFTDMRMPGLSGTHVLEYSKSLKNKPTPIVGMSGTPWLLDNNAFDAVLSKPFSNEAIFKIINEFT